MTEAFLDSEMPFQHVTVVGLGLIGGSLAMAIKDRFPNCQVVGVDPNAEALQYALKHNVIDQASLTLPEALPSHSLIVLACHLEPSLQVLRQIAPALQDRSDCLVKDIGSCKRQIVALGKELLPTQFIGGHPMAGKEFSGIHHATPLLFAGKSYLLCPHAETPKPALNKLQQLITGLGAIPKLIDAERHDRYMAYVSHLPQLYSVLLAQLLAENEPGHLMAYHGAGLDDQLRLAASSYSMWGDILAQNGDQLANALRGLRQQIDSVLPLLEKSEREPFAPLFHKANQMHSHFQAMRAQRLSGQGAQ